MKSNLLPSQFLIYGVLASLISSSLPCLQSGLSLLYFLIDALAINISLN